MPSEPDDTTENEDDNSTWVDEGKTGSYTPIEEKYAPPENPDDMHVPEPSFNSKVQNKYNRFRANTIGRYIFIILVTVFAIGIAALTASILGVGVLDEVPLNDTTNNATEDLSVATVAEVDNATEITVVHELNSKTETVVLAGANTPSADGTVQPSEYGLANTSVNQSCLHAWGDVANTESRLYLENESVILLDANATTDVNRKYAVSNNTTASEYLLSNGYATVPDSEFDNRKNMTLVENQARQENVGVWGCPTKPDVRPVHPPLSESN